jgi:predicted RNA-binding protein Jag
MYILLAFVIFILIILLYILFKDNDEKRRKRCLDDLSKSSGSFDDNARLALDELFAMENPLPEDHFQRAEIIRYNLLEGDVLQNQNPVNRRNAVGTIVRDYVDTVHGIRDVDMRRNLMDARPVDPGFMLFHIAELGDRFENVHDDDEVVEQLIAMFNNVVQTEVPIARQELINARVTNAAANANSRLDAINKTLDSAVVYTNQLQNVHDNAVNSDLKSTLKKLRDTYRHERIDGKKAIDEARQYIIEIYEYADVINPVTKANSALRTLDIFSRGEYITTFNESEDNIFALVWERCKHPNNEQNAENMRESICNALADCFELYKGAPDPVCINGRCSRVIGSLATLDYDKSVGDAMTCEAYKNQIFQETKDIINEIIEDAKNSTDVEKNKVALLYDAEITTDEVDATALGLIHGEIKNAIDANLNNYIGKLRETELNNIKMECYTYALLSD